MAKQLKLSTKDFGPLLAKYLFTWTEKRSQTIESKTNYYPPLITDSVKGTKDYHEIQIRYIGTTKLNQTLMRDRLFDILCDMQSYDKLAPAVKAAYEIIKDFWEICALGSYRSSVYNTFTQLDFGTKVSVLNSLDGKYIRFFKSYSDLRYANYDIQKKITTRGNRERLMAFGQLFEEKLAENRALECKLEANHELFAFMQDISNYISMDFDGHVKYHLAVSILTDTDINYRFKDTLDRITTVQLNELEPFKSTIQMYTSQCELVNNLKKFD